MAVACCVWVVVVGGLGNCLVYDFRYIPENGKTEEVSAFKVASNSQSSVYSFIYLFELGS